ncbi:hypothetical protein ACFX15_005593 [Malus domestica]
MCSSQPSRIKPQRPLKKFPAKFKIKPRRPLRKSQVRFKIKCLSPLNQNQFKNKLWEVNKCNKIRADSSTTKATTKAKDHLPHEAPYGPIPTVLQDQASTALEEISNKSSRTSLNGP